MTTAISPHAQPIADSIEKFDHALNATELSRLLGVNKLTIYRLAEQGRIPAFRIASAIRFDPHRVAAWLREREAR